MKRTIISAWIIGIAALVTGIAPLTQISPAAASPPAGSLSGLVASDESFSAGANRLVDGIEGANPSDAWVNSDNPWSSSSYPMAAVIDLGELHDIEAVHYFGGQIPFPSTAALDIETSVDGAAYETLITATAPAYDTWSPPISANVQARYLRLSFASDTARFDLTEVAVIGTPVGPVPDTGSGTPVSTGTEITSLVAADGANSSNAARLTDGVVGPDSDQAWINPNPWNPNNFPMTAIIDLGASYNITEVHYHVGNIFQPEDNQITWESSAAETGPFVGLASGSQHRWNDWHEEIFPTRLARRLRVTFSSQPTMFNLSEVKVFADGAGEPDEDEPSEDEPSEDEPSENQPPTGEPNDAVCPLPNHWADAHCESQNVIDSFGERPLPAGAATGMAWNTIDDYYSDYGDRPGICSQEVHNSYWTAVADADDNLSYYPSWHPPIHNEGQADECRFTHEHGVDPTSSDLYDEAHPTNVGVPFGFVHPGGIGHGGGRVEDHVGHKVIVENDFQLTINNPYQGAGVALRLFSPNGQSVTCDWYSKLHQGTHSDDALGFNMHEYYLNYSCDDGTEARIKEMTHFGFHGLKVNDPFDANNLPIAKPGFPLTGGNGSVDSDCGWFATNFTGPLIDTDPSSDRNFGDAKRAFSCLVSDAKVEELWKPSAALKGPDGGPSFNYDPYYVVMNPNRYALYDWWNLLVQDGDHVGEDAMISMVDLCVAGTELRNELSRADAPANFVKDNRNYDAVFRVKTWCDSINPVVVAQWESDIVDSGGDSEALMTQRAVSVDNPFVGTRRGVHTKGPVIYGGSANFDSLSLFCTDVLGNDSQWPTNPITGEAVTAASPWSAGDPDPVCDAGVAQLLSTVSNGHSDVEGSTAGATWNGSSFVANGPAGEIVIDIDSLYPGHGVQAPN